MRKLSLLTISLILIANSALAEPPSCPDVVKACDAAVTQLVKERKMTTAILQTMKERDLLMQSEIADLKGEVTSWYRNPAILGISGMVLGLVVGGIVFKQ